MITGRVMLLVCNRKRKGRMRGMLGKPAADDNEADDFFMTDYGVEDLDLDESLPTNAVRKKAKPSHSNTGSFSGITGLLDDTSQLPNNDDMGCIPKSVEENEHQPVVRAEGAAACGNSHSWDPMMTLQELGQQQTSQPEQKVHVEARRVVLPDTTDHIITDSSERQQTLTTQMPVIMQVSKGCNDHSFNLEAAGAANALRQIVIEQQQSKRQLPKSQQEQLQTSQWESQC
eukprot:gene11938-12081_t